MSGAFPNPADTLGSLTLEAVLPANQDSDEPDLLYVGNSLGLERSLLGGTGLRSIMYPMAAPSSPRGIILLALATVRSIALVARVRPRVTFATGGYVSTPVALASWLLRVPLVLFLPDIVPGRAVVRLTPLARRIAVSTDAAVVYLPADKTEVTGYPVRDVFRRTHRDRARARFDLPLDARVLCVFGGSQGARSINHALGLCLPDVLEHWYVLHVCGEERLIEAESAASTLSAEQRVRYRLFPYLHDQAMADALGAADLAVCRSGASTLGELPATGTPAILVPLPAGKVHQRANAEYLASRGAAVIIPDDDLGERLSGTLADLASDRARLAALAKSCKALDRPHAAENIAAMILREAS